MLLTLSTSPSVVARAIRQRPVPDNLASLLEQQGDFA